MGGNSGKMKNCRVYSKKTATPHLIHACRMPGKTGVQVIKDPLLLHEHLTRQHFLGRTAVIAHASIRSGAFQVLLQSNSGKVRRSAQQMMAAAVAGHGVALGRRPLIDALLKKRQLVVPFGEATATARAYFLLLSPSAAARPDAQALALWLRAQAAAIGATG